MDRYEAEQDPEKLLQMMLNLLDKEIRMFGVDGGPTANARLRIARQLESMGRRDEARVYLEQVVASYRRNRGDDDLMTAQKEEFLAVSLAEDGLTADAVGLLEHVESVYRSVLGNDNEETKRVRDRIELIAPSGGG